MISEPRIEERTEKPYIAASGSAKMEDLSEAIPARIHEIVGWIMANGVPQNIPFVRYLGMRADGTLDFEAGIPITGDVTVSGAIKKGSLPAGRYAVLIHTGDYSGLKDAHMAMIDWGERNGAKFACAYGEGGERFGARVESYITDPGCEPDPSKWETEVSFLLAD